MSESYPRIAFFGGEPLGVPALEELKRADIIPQLVVCNPDRPAGRGQKLTPPPVKIWAQNNSIEVFQPTSYKNQTILEPILNQEWDLFVVVAYNFILPQWLLEIPKHGVINVHPSLLPKLRGASPIRTAIKDNLRDDIGVTVMLMDEQMDHGPILKQEAIAIDEDVWPIAGPELDTLLAHRGGELLTETIPAWLSGTITSTPQSHEHATYTSRFTKEAGLLQLDPHHLPTGTEALKTLCHIQAFLGIGDSYFIHNDIKVKIKQAKLADDGSLRLLRVIPAGKPEMDFERYLQSL